MWEYHLLHLKQDDIVIPLPSTLEGWEDDLKKWPQITYTSIFCYFIDSRHLTTFRSTHTCEAVTYVIGLQVHKAS